MEVNRDGQMLSIPSFPSARLRVSCFKFALTTLLAMLLSHPQPCFCLIGGTRASAGRLLKELCNGREACYILRDANHPSSYDSCPHTCFHREADITKTHTWMSFVKILDHLQCIKIAFHISHMGFLWHNWLVLKISHLSPPQ